MCQEQLSLWKRFMRLFELAGGSIASKTHAVLHMARRQQFQGNCRFYSTGDDDSDNKLIRQILRLCPQQTFERQAFGRMRTSKRQRLRAQNADTSMLQTTVNTLIFARFLKVTVDTTFSMSTDS